MSTRTLIIGLTTQSYVLIIMPLIMLCQGEVLAAFKGLHAPKDLC